MIRPRLHFGASARRLIGDTTAVAPVLAPGPVPPAGPGASHTRPPIAAEGPLAGLVDALENGDPDHG